MSVNLIITFDVKKEKLQSFMNLVQDVKKNLPQVDGCKDVKIMTIHDNPSKVIFIETWETIAQHKQHIKQVIDSGDWEYISSHLLVEPKSDYYNEII